MNFNELVVIERKRKRRMAILCMLPLIILASVTIIPSAISSLSLIGLSTAINLLVAIGAVVLCIIGLIILPPI